MVGRWILLPGILRLINNVWGDAMTCPHCTATNLYALAHRTALGYRTYRCRRCKRTCNERTGTPFNFLEYPTDVVLSVVRWRLQYKLSLRDLAQMFLERGITFTHEAVREWEARFAPVLTDRLRAKRRGKAGSRWYVEIVCTQIAKTEAFAVRAGGNGIADVDVIIGDHHAINQELHQLALLLEGRAGKACLDALAEGLNVGDEPRYLVLPCGLGSEVLLLERQALVLLFQIAAAPLVFCQGDYAVQVGLREALHLLCQAGPSLPQIGLARLHRLRQPLAALGTFESLADAGGVAHHGAQIRPHQRFKLPRRNEPSGTAALAMRALCLMFARTDVVSVPRGTGLGRTGGLAPATTD